jgi:hypothetical protein
MEFDGEIKENQIKGMWYRSDGSRGVESESMEK